jgi:hypothetical protein
VSVCPYQERQGGGRMRIRRLGHHSRRLCWNACLWFVAGWVWYANAAPLSDGRGEKNMEAKMIHVELNITNCSAEVYLNDIPLKKLDTPQQPLISIPAQQFLIEGTNCLELVVHPGKTPSLAKQGAARFSVPGAAAEARVVRYVEGMYTGDPAAEKLAVVSWHAQGAEPETFPKILDKEFNLHPAFGRWAWQDADTIDLRKDGQAIRKVVQAVFEAFRTGEAAAVLQLGALRLEEGARAYPARSLDSLRRRQADYFTRNATREGWAVEPLDDAQFDFRICAKGKMVEIIDRNWQPTIRSKPMQSGDVFPFPMFLSKLKGQFVVIR